LRLQALDVGIARKPQQENWLEFSPARLAPEGGYYEREIRNIF
jgi:hypothetical protein